MTKIIADIINKLTNKSKKRDINEYIEERRQSKIRSFVSTQDDFDLCCLTLPVEDIIKLYPNVPQTDIILGQQIIKKQLIDMINNSNLIL